MHTFPQLSSHDPFLFLLSFPLFLLLDSALLLCFLMQSILNVASRYERKHVTFAVWSLVFDMISTSNLFGGYHVRLNKPDLERNMPFVCRICYFKKMWKYSRRDKETGRKGVKGGGWGLKIKWRLGGKNHMCLYVCDEDAVLAGMQTTAVIQV